MKIAEDSQDRLVIVNEDKRFSRTLMGLCVVCVITLIILAGKGSYNHDGERLWGLAVGAGLFFLGSFAVSESGKFFFDRRNREFHWERKRFLVAGSSGTVPFAKIREVVVQTLGHPANPGRRVALILDDGELPLSTAYVPGKTELHEEVQAKILEIVEGARHQ